MCVCLTDPVHCLFTAYLFVCLFLNVCVLPDLALKTLTSCTLANFMEHSHSSQANISSASQEKVHCHVQNSPPLVPIFSPDQSSSCRPILFVKIHFNIMLSLPQVFQVVSFPNVSRPKHRVRLPSPPEHGTYTARFFIHDFFTRIIFGPRVGIWSSLLCNFLHFPAIYSLLGPNSHLSTLCSNTLRLSVIPWMQETNFTATWRYVNLQIPACLSVFIFRDGGNGETQHYGTNGGRIP